MNSALILGGYGNFGKRIAELLTQSGYNVIIAGRDAKKADQLLESLPKQFASKAIFDIKDIREYLPALSPKVVINTCGPFQESDYSVAQVCAENGVHYIDLADGRDFVGGITELDGIAKKNGVAVISGASTVPALSSAVLERYMDEFAAIDSLCYGISPGQKSERGLATTKAILGYVGKKLRSCAGYKYRYGWQDLYVQKYPILGYRLMSNCDIPDLDLLPVRYGIKKIKFSAGMELSFIHLGIWLLSWLVRFGFIRNLENYAASLLKMSNAFNWMGSADGGMHIIMDGMDKNGNPLQKKWFIVALNGDGPYIPTIPSVILAKKILDGARDWFGAMPCVGLITLEEYLKELRNLHITTYEF